VLTECTETFWIDLVLRNPLDADVTLSDLSVNISGESEDLLSCTEIESLDEIRLGGKEQRTVSLGRQSTHFT
jgi:trafficking protein particle complex subunit 8